LGRIVTHECERREPDVVVEPTRIARKPCTVGVLRALEIAELGAHQAERMKGASVPRVASHGLAESRLGYVELTPGDGAHASGFRAGRVAGSHGRRVIKKLERHVIAVAELVGVPELEPWHGAFLAELLRQHIGFVGGAPEITEGTVNADQQPALAHEGGVTGQLALEQLRRLPVLPFVRKHDGPLARRRRVGAAGREQRKRRREHDSRRERGRKPAAHSDADEATTTLARPRPDCYESEMNAEGLARVAVIGAGQMGSGIAQVLCSKGIEVALCDVTLERAEAGSRSVLARLERLAQKGKLEASVLEQARKKLVAKGFDAALESAELVIEAASEDPALKRDLFTRADARAPAGSLLCSNTSSISITVLGAATKRPELVVGMHVMNPVPLMKLVEVVRGVATSQATIDSVLGLCARLDKTPILSLDSPGFLVNRMLIPFINEACFALQEGLGSVDDIDQGARLGLNHPLGPLELADLIGLDTVLAIAEVLQRGLGDDKYRPPTLLRNLVAAGYLGKKSGRGFHSYDEQGQKRGI